MNRLQYNIRFIENVKDLNNVSDEEFRLIKNDLKNRLTDCLSKAGFSLASDIELDFDMIGDNDYETWR